MLFALDCGSVRPHQNKSLSALDRIKSRRGVKLNKSSGSRRALVHTAALERVLRLKNIVLIAELSEYSSRRSLLICVTLRWLLCFCCYEMMVIGLEEFLQVYSR